MTEPGELGDAVRQLFRALEHAGDLPPADRGEGEGRILCGEAGRERLGTRVRFMLRRIDDRLVQVRYRAYGCPHTLAVCEWLARRLEGQPWPGLHPPDSPRDWARALGVPAGKLGRLLVVEDALRAAMLQSSITAGAEGESNFRTPV